jgi:RNA polymerase sigma factor (sigma-70 family)
VVHVPGPVTASADFDGFCRTEYPRLVGAMSLYLRDPQEAEDVAQEALVRACRRWRRVSRLDSPGGWTYRCAVNLARSSMRRRLVRRRVEPRLVERDHGADDAEASALRMLVHDLPDTQRAVVVARFFLRLTVAETADVLGLSEDSVRGHAKRALQSLRTAYDLSPHTRSPR